MSELARQVYIISDLHLGGSYDEGGKGRGFRINTRVPELTAFVQALVRKPPDAPKIELIINGDSVDFLAEKEDKAPFWRSFTHDPDLAAGKMEAIAARDREFFDALGDLLRRGHRLTILLGNHDIELGLPQVRQKLQSILGVKGSHDYQLIYNGEAYIVGDALIEHGNRYDPFNVVNYDWLRRVCSLHSRRQPVDIKEASHAPAGSSMVSQVINPIKQDYRFVDLLKPPVGHTVPLLLALEPGYRKILATVAKLSMQARTHKLAGAAMPAFGGDIHSSGETVSQEFGSDISSTDDTDPDQALNKILSEEMGQAEGKTFLTALEPGRSGGANGGARSSGGIGEDISAMDFVERHSGIVGLLLARQKEGVNQRLPSLWKALKVLQTGKGFDRDIETETDYLEAARDLSNAGFRYVIFGHTHAAKKVHLQGDSYYMNSGSWADFMKVPDDILDETDSTMGRLREFVEAIGRGEIGQWVGYEPTYIRLDLDGDGKIQAAELCDYTGPESV